MKLQYCVARHDTYELRKAVQDDGDNTLVIYELIDWSGKREIVKFSIRGEWEEMAFELCFQGMIQEWTKNKQELEIQEENSESPIESMLFQELQGIFQGTMIQQHEFFENARIITRPDIYLPEHGICIYCDGHEFHEKTKEQAKRDRSIDRWIQEQGMKVLRFTGSEIWNDPQKCAEQVLNFIS